MLPRLSPMLGLQRVTVPGDTRYMRPQSPNVLGESMQYMVHAMQDMKVQE